MRVIKVKETNLIIYRKKKTIENFYDFNHKYFICLGRIIVVLLVLFQINIIFGFEISKFYAWNIFVFSTVAKHTFGCNGVCWT